MFHSEGLLVTDLHIPFCEHPRTLFAIREKCRIRGCNSLEMRWVRHFCKIPRRSRDESERYAEEIGCLERTHHRAAVDFLNWNFCCERDRKSTRLNSSHSQIS